MMKESKHIKHDKKRKRINVSLYSKDQKLMKDKYGIILDSFQAKEILLRGECTVISKVVNPDISKIVVELKRIGNNINQMAFLANAKKDIPSEMILLQQLKDIKDAIKMIREK